MNQNGKYQFGTYSKICKPYKIIFNAEDRKIEAIKFFSS